jgi:xanthine dehydrogenase YagS FAD-binding subunit
VPWMARTEMRHSSAAARAASRRMPRISLLRLQRSMRTSSRGAIGERGLALQDPYPLPSATTAPDSSLTAGDIITAIRIHDASRFAPRSIYLKIRDRASFEFAVVSVAAALRIEGGVIAEARLAAGGVAPLPWRLGRSEAALIGRAPTKQAFLAAVNWRSKAPGPCKGTRSRSPCCVTRSFAPFKRSEANREPPISRTL